MNKTWTLDVKQHEDGDYFIEFPDEAVERFKDLKDVVEFISRSFFA